MSQQILVAGENDAKQISVNGAKVIDHTTPIGISFSNVISYSVYRQHAVLVLEGGNPSAIGDNTGWPIYANLGKNLKQWKTFSIVENSIHYLVESAVCGSNYTLYLVKESSDSSSRKLAYVQRNRKKGHPYFLNTKGWLPVSIYGGCDTAAAIDERGAIHIIPSSIVSTPDFTTTIKFLPNNELAISVAFQEDFIVALSAFGLVYETKLGSDGQYFHRVKELEGKFFRTISGKLSHCIAVSTDGLVYCRGENEDGRLGIGNKSKSNKFLQVLTLKNVNIVDASAGAFHSLFVNSDGKVYSCGYNGFGEDLLNDSESGDIVTPRGTCISSGARFCIAGKQNSIVFVNVDVPKNSPNQTLDLVDSFPYPAMFKRNGKTLLEISQLRSKNSEMANKLILKDDEISNLKNANNLLQSNNNQFKKENSQLTNTVNQVKQSNMNLKNAINDLNKTIESKNIEIEKLKKEVEEMKKKIQSDEIKSIENNSKADTNEYDYDVNDEYNKDDVLEENEYQNVDSINIKKQEEEEEIGENDDIDEDDEYDDNSADFKE